MKRQLFTYILAAFCATAILSCNKEAANDSIAPDDECTVLLSASIDASTKAVGFDESKVVCTWTVGDTVKLVRDNDAKIISKLIVTSVDGDKAQLSGQLRGSYGLTGTNMSLYYGGTCYDYSGQDGTVESAASKAYLKAATKIDSLVGKTFYLHDAVMEHQQSYMGLSFYRGGTPLKVHSVAITEGGQNIIRRHPHDSSDVAVYGTNPFIVKSQSTVGQEVFYFALSDTTTNSILDHKYELEIMTITANTPTNDTTVYKGTVTPANLKGNFFADAKVILERVSPVITAPSVYPEIYYDGLHLNLVNPAVLQPGAIAEYGVSTVPDVVPTVWSTSIPTRTDVGSYIVWYKVEGGDYYDNILPTMVGATYIKTVSGTTIQLPTGVSGLYYNCTAQTLLYSDGKVWVNSSVVSTDLEYYVKEMPLDSDPPTPPTGDEATGWSSVIPKGTQAGEYYIWCRYNGNTSLGYLPAMNGPVKVIIRLPITITAANQTVTQGGSIKQYSDDPDMVTFSTPVLGIHTFTVTLTADTSTIGVFTEGITPSIVIKSGETDVTNIYYKITYARGTLTVTASTP